MKELKFDQFYITNTFVQQFSDIFQNNTTIDSLSLTSCYGVSGYLLQLFDLLCYNKYIKTLEISGHYALESVAIGKIISSNNKITHLTLELLMNTNDIFLALCVNKTIRCFCLNQSVIEPICVSNMFQYNTTLTHIDISNNKYDRWYDFVDDIKHLRNNQTLQYLNLNKLLVFDTVKNISSNDVYDELYENGKLIVDCMKYREFVTGYGAMDLFDKLNERNWRMRRDCKTVCVYFLNQHKNKRSLSLPKDVLVCVCKMVWDSRFEVKTWSPPK